MKQVRNVQSALDEVPGSMRDRPGSDHEWKAQGAVHVLQEEIEDLSAAYDSILFDQGTAEYGRSPSSDPVLIVELPPEIEDQSKPLISSEEAAEIEARIAVTGVDALGWYVTFHQRSYQWGIYINLHEAAYLADYVLAQSSPSRGERIMFAIQAILRHELVHFAADYMSAQWELATGLPCYWPAVDALKNARLAYNALEEQIANAYLLRGFRYPSDRLRALGAYGALSEWVLTCPPGYRDGKDLLGAAEFRAALARLSTVYEAAILRPHSAPLSGFDHLSMYPQMHPIESRYCPIMLVYDGKAAQLPPDSVQLISSIADLEETPRFRKNLDRMHPRFEQLWSKTKKQLARSVSLNSLDFKKWSADTFSVRVDRGVRAHIVLDRKSGSWKAEKIGSHTAMGHG